MKISPAVSAALCVIGVGVAAFLLFDLLPVQEFSLIPTENAQPLTIRTIHSIPFPNAQGAVHITEPMAHVRIPLRRSVLGKRLVVRTDFRLENGNRVELGMKKGSFWQDYERRELLRDVHTPGEKGAVVHREVIFDAQNAFVNDDGSIELMFFIHGLDEDHILLFIDTLEIRIESGQWNVATLFQRARGALRDLLRRPSA